MKIGRVSLQPPSHPRFGKSADLPLWQWSGIDCFPPREQFITTPVFQAYLSDSRGVR